MEDVTANHYSIPKGRIRLRKALVEYLSASFNLPEGRKLDVENEVIVTAGPSLCPLWPVVASR